jgi:hypothetical protein
MTSTDKKIGNQSVLVKHLMRMMVEEIYGGLATKKSLNKQRKEIIKELDKLIRIANKEVK